MDAILYHGDPGAARILAVEYRAGIKAAVLERVPPEVGGKLRWADSLYPTLVSVTALEQLSCAGLERVSVETRKWLFHNDTGLTEVERGDGILPGIQKAGARPGAVLSIGELQRIFAAQVMPAELQQSSRTAYWTVWRLSLIHI